MQDEPLDLREILAGFRRWWWVFLAAPLLIGAAAAGAAIASPVPEPRYESSATLLVEGSAATASYPSLIVSRPFLNAVIDQSALDLSLDEMVATVSARRVPETEFLEILATTADPATGRQVADSVAAAFIGHIESIREEQLAVQHIEVEQGVVALGLFSTTGALVDTVKAALERNMPVFGRVTLVVPAEEPVIPVPTEPRPIVRNGLLAAGAGLLLSVGVIMLLEYQRAPIGSPALFQRRFGLSNLGAVPRWSKGTGRAKELAANGGSSSPEGEAIRQVATNIEFGARGKGIKSLAVTSPDLGEGRSSLIANLGYAMSSSQEKVVLVDADLRRPSLHTYFKLENGAGLSDFLSNPEIDIHDILRDTVYSGVRVITSGPPAADPVGLLKSHRMHELLKRLEADYHMVLVDTPPLVSLADGAVVAAQVGGSILVVNTSISRLDAVGLALGNLEQAGANMLGFIWNGASSGSLSRYSRYQKHCRKQTEAGRSAQLAPGRPA